ncbi:carnitine dehydratase [Salinibacter sp. 10B]|uniref:CaiB/BaiF CoA transferase family protein n=1 Tax=Salinibacter sp. 10B TaxID=1923971 RepID=UPI000CF4D876|nr:CaiB/BaiF CoA-transferase family protein [Salinibacter sp. 10B]PQJ33713.1 carnitine dehydratase [Salinibacter sp. 10B]
MLHDLVVLELASVLAGPSVGQFFAELGATVLKVENPRTKGDVTRQWSAPNGASTGETDDRSAYFCCCNHGKQSLALNLSTDAGQNLLFELAKEADIVLASYRPGTAHTLGADYPTLSEANPDLIYGHITGYGPDRARAGYDAVIQAESGFMHMNGPSDGPPTKLPVALMDVLAAHQLKEGLLVALLKRERGDDGAYVPVSLFQSAVSGLVHQATNWLVAGHSPDRMGSAHPNIAPYGTPYPTGDGPSLVLAVGTDRQFKALCEVIDRPDLADDPRFASNAQRVEHRDVLDRELEDRFSHFDTDELLGALHARNVPAGIVRDVPTVFEQSTAKTMVLRPEDSPAGLRQTAFPHPDGAFPALSPPPHYAEHTTQILRDHLGYSPEQIRSLHTDGVIPGT